MLGGSEELWRNLEAHLIVDQEVAGSSPVNSAMERQADLVTAPALKAGEPLALGVQLSPAPYGEVA
jgi:hypothetical protein